MLARKQNKNERCQGMSLVELIISAGVVSLVVAGAIGSTLLFAKLAMDHENRADFASDIRIGFEQMSFDVRNAKRITSRTNTSFNLSFSDGTAVGYTYNQNTGVITRSESGNRRALLRNIDEFDVLTGVADQPADGSLRYDKNELSIEQLRFRASRGAAGSSKFDLQNITLKLRNG